MTDAERTPRVLSIAGSDSGGGAGIQADLKAFARCGVHGMTAITAVTAQNTRGGHGRLPAAARGDRRAGRAVAEDIGVDAVKIGMLGTAETIETVAAALDLISAAPVVLDPVMIAESGARLLDEERARRAARQAAAARDGRDAQPSRGADPGGRRGRRPRDAREAIHALGARAVVVTGGHRDRGHRRLLRRRAARRDPRRAPPRRGGARLGLHALVGARGRPRARPRAARGGRGREADRLRGGAGRPARRRRGRRPGRRHRPRESGEPGTPPCHNRSVRRRAAERVTQDRPRRRDRSSSCA